MCKNLFLGDEPEAGDYTTPDHIHFFQFGRLVLSVPEGDSIAQALLTHMGEESFFPSVFFISDHGNCHLINLENYK